MQSPGNRLLDFLWDSSKTAFASLKKNPDRVNFVLDKIERYRLCFYDGRNFLQESKSDGRAAEDRESGNRQFAQGKHLAALELYTRSIARAENKPTLALAYANRSAALFKLDLHDECVMDIDRALEHGYPEKLKPKLITRRENSLKLTDKAHSPYEDIPEIHDPNPSIQSANSCIEIESNDKFGRHIVATRDIDIGEILMVEQPFACVVKDDFAIHCHECMYLCYNPIPCSRNCTIALYCSVKCRDLAWDKYHRFECAISYALDKFLIKKFHHVVLALKMSFMASDQQQQVEVYRSDRYYEVHDLVTNIENLPLKELFGACFFAAQVYGLVKHHTDFFTQSRRPEDSFKEDMLVNMKVCNSNAVAIEEICLDSHDSLDEATISKFGSGIYSLFSIFNHSCARNVEYSSRGSTKILQARRTIKKGDQCFVSYGYNFDHLSKEQRQNELNRLYHFTCECRACAQDWPCRLDSEPLDNIHQQVYQDMLLKIRTGVDPIVNYVTKMLPKLYRDLRGVEDDVRSHDVYYLQKTILNCYHILGNKRKL